MPCDDCTTATERLHHGFGAFCRGCWARGISRGPDFARVRQSKVLDKPYLDLLQRTSVTHAEVKAAAETDAMQHIDRVSTNTAQSQDAHTSEPTRHAKPALGDEVGRATKAPE